MNRIYIVTFVVLSVACTTTALLSLNIPCPIGCAARTCSIGIGCIRCSSGYCMSSMRIGGRRVPFCTMQCPRGQECRTTIPGMNVCTASRRTTTTRSWRRG